MASPEELTFIVRRLREQRRRIAFAESCTGGRLVADLTTIPGSSNVVAGSAVTYEPRAKSELLGLPEEDVLEQNIVSAKTAQLMANGARLLFHTAIGVATTGWLDGHHHGQGPHAFWAILVEATPTTREVRLHHRVDFHPGSSREDNRQHLVDEVFAWLGHFLRSEE